jgi:hypothetical protein
MGRTLFGSPSKTTVFNTKFLISTRAKRARIWRRRASSNGSTPRFPLTPLCTVLRRLYRTRKLRKCWVTNPLIHGARANSQHGHASIQRHLNNRAASIAMLNGVLINPLGFAAQRPTARPPRRSRRPSPRSPLNGCACSERKVSRKGCLSSLKRARTVLNLKFSYRRDSEEAPPTGTAGTGSKPNATSTLCPICIAEGCSGREHKPLPGIS